MVLGAVHYTVGCLQAWLASTHHIPVVWPQLRKTKMSPYTAKYSQWQRESGVGVYTFITGGKSMI
jgi:uncharacterized protein (DUF1810 family)